MNGLMMCRSATRPSCTSGALSQHLRITPCLSETHGVVVNAGPDVGRVALAARRLLEQADQAQMVDAMQLVLSHGTAQDTPITENPIQVRLRSPVSEVFDCNWPLQMSCAKSLLKPVDLTSLVASPLPHGQMHVATCIGHAACPPTCGFTKLTR